MRRGDFLENAPGQLVPVTLTEIQPPDFRPIERSAMAFLPDPLPIDLHLVGLDQRLEAAAQAIGTLNGLATLLTSPYLLIRPFLRREAVASSRIEGTVADFRQLVLFEESEETAPPDSDVQEVYNYVRALEYGLQFLPTRPISAALMREMHRFLMEGVRGGDRSPGEYRRGHVYIGQRGTNIETALCPSALARGTSIDARS